MPHHWFWWIVTAACVVWYSTITVYVAFKGAKDIKNMLARLDATKNEKPGKLRTRREWRLSGPNRLSRLR